MKESGIEWLDSIPKNWDTLRIKNVVTNIVNGNWGQDEQSDSDDISVIRVADFNRSNSKVNNVEFTIRNIKNIYEKDEQLINPKQDLLIEKSGGGDKTPVGQVVHYAESKPATFTNFISKLTINTSLMNLSFMNYYFSALYSNGIPWKHIKQTTGIQNLDVKSYLNEKMPVPKLEIQNKITYFLDEKTSEIDNIVEKTKQSIEELKAYKQSLITETVTKGLNPDAPMKDSGIEWIGKIPQNWETVKIKYIGNAKNGLTYKPVDLVDEGQGVLILRSGNIKAGNLVSHNDYYVTPDIVSENFMLKEGDILICSRNGSKELIGKNALITKNDEYTFGAFMMRFRPYENVNSEYIYYILNSEVFNYYLGSFLTSTISQLTLSNFNNMNVVLPTSHLEQRKIVDYLNQRSQKIDSLIKKKQQIVKELEAYKLSLIYEYVTGKKEVK